MVKTNSLISVFDEMLVSYNENKKLNYKRLYYLNNFLKHLETEFEILSIFHYFENPTH